jgi:hypothetical protein
LIAQKGYPDAVLPTAETIGTKLNELVAWQSSIDRLIWLDSPARHAWWFEEKEIPHGQISCHPHG